MPSIDESSASHQAFLSASLLGRERGRIRRLKGFLKGVHFEPQTHSAAAESFVRKAGSPDIEEQAETLFRQLREGFSYKRKELVYSCDTGLAAIRTPDFEVTLSADQDPGEARACQLSLTVEHFTRPEVVTEDAFIAIFRLHCDTIRIQFPEAIDVEAKIDALESSPRLAQLLDYPADAGWLSIQLPEPSVRMELRSDAVTFTIPRGGDLRELIHGTIRLLSDFRQSGNGLLLS